MSAVTELVALEEISADKAPVIYGHNKLADYVAKAREAVVGEVPDLKTRKGRERIASLAAAVSRSKTAVEKPGRDYLKRLKEMPKAIEAELREFTQQMDALRDEVRKPLDDWEAAEQARVDAHQAALSQIDELATVLEGTTAEQLSASIAQVEAVELGDQWEEFAADAGKLKDKALSALRDALTKRQKYEAEQAELAELRRQQAEREAQDERDRIAREAEERGRREAEQRAQADRNAAAKREADAKAEAERRELQLKLQAEQADRERLEAQRRAEQAERDAGVRAEQAAAAERKRQADFIAEEARQAQRREADIEHKKQINNAALAAFIAGGMPEECAKQAVTLIAKRQIPHVLISY